MTDTIIWLEHLERYEVAWHQESRGEQVLGWYTVQPATFSRPVVVLLSSGTETWRMYCTLDETDACHHTAIVRQAHDRHHRVDQEVAP